jgi:hypothetical protein
MGTVSPASRPGSSPPPSNQPYSKPPRSALGARHLLGALAVLIPLVLLAGGLSQCSFSPGGPSVDPAAGPSVDAAAELRALAPRTPFPLRVPAVPEGWRVNAVDEVPVADGRGVRAGYLTPEGRYLRLWQSDAGEEALLMAEAGGVPPGRGTVDVGGQRWVVYGGEGEEPVWVAEVPGLQQGDPAATPGAAPVRLLITGSADEAGFRALAEGALDGEVLLAGQP